ncbi:SDR family NAD(P)-dependent oxidoreductase [Vibrio sp. Of7-15]|uniref:SDR family NAD(P)-dependent oxidoreductase n=1 Tax=Vibrio sp. Of7-15 TaxID=2724879 RepID=UPI001EF3A23C|nr:SDR family NAD(P)-dependent oxidoreductase [Vibrio sp. Of7-15]MCG7497870.1 SDR family NAD(P)-dependent oxidoreductase [Vibrio sp. Of7-15]
MRVLITGSTSGIGKELACSYAKSGHEVIACGRRESKLKLLTQQYPSISTLCFDLVNYDAYPALEDNAAPLDVVILNAGDCEYMDNVVDFDAKMFERVMNINVISIGYCLQAWLKHIKPGGRVVLISSSAGQLPLPRAEAYGASKAALTYLGKTLTISLCPRNINVTVVHPGFVETPLTDKNTFPMPMLISSKEAAERIITGIDNGDRDISFPSVFILVIKMLRCLPSLIWNRIAIRMVSE